jgi:fluoroacetyl-CoA thioesterase
MPAIPIGAKLERLVAVTDENSISFLGHPDARVLATPWLIAHLEWAARDAVKPYLSDGQDTVGTHVNVAHLAATPIGMEARFYAEVTAADDRRVTYRVEAWDEKDKIGEGTHERAIIDIDRFAKRVRAKRSAE